MNPEFQRSSRHSGRRAGPPGSRGGTRTEPGLHAAEGTPPFSLLSPRTLRAGTLAAVDTLPPSHHVTVQFSQVLAARPRRPQALRHLASECVGKDARTAPQHNFCNRLDVISFLATFCFLSYASENSVLGLWDCRFTEEKPDLKNGSSHDSVSLQLAPPVRVPGG